MTSSWRTLAVATAAGVVIAMTLNGMARAITDTVFRYSPERTGWYTMHPMAFAPFNTAATNANYGLFSSNIGAPQGGCFTTGVNLPQGAKMKTLAVWYSSDQPNGVIVQFERQNVVTGATDTLGTLLSTDTSEDRTVMTLALPASTAGTVNNHQYAYALFVCLNGVNDEYRAGRITYTYATAGD